MNDYYQRLKETYGNLEINLVKHDTGSAPGCLPAYIEVHLGKTPKDKGETVLDLGNYIYSVLGLHYRQTPEYRGRGKKTTLRWFMDKRDFEHIRMNVIKAYKGDKADYWFKIEGYIPYEFNSLIIQNTARGIHPRSEAAT